jgi:hypothetical protein
MAKPPSPVIGFRLDPESAKLLAETAAAHGMDAAPYARVLVLKGLGAAANMMPVRRRVLHAAELRQLLAELGRQGSNLNQIARHLNGGAPANGLRTAIAQLDSEHAACLRAVTSLLVGAAQ